MRSYLIAYSLWQHVQDRRQWSFSGADDRTLRACLDELDEFLSDDLDSWQTEALVFGFADRDPMMPERAWTLAGATRLAELLPDSLSDVRDELTELLATRLVEPPESAVPEAPLRTRKRRRPPRRTDAAARREISEQLADEEPAPEPEPER